MKEDIQVIEKFNRYAKHTLENHLSELKTRYENEPMSSREMVADAYKAHQKIYRNELEGKIKLLLEDEKDDSAKSELEKSRDTFLSKLNYTE